ncbi:hypothetical protein O3G_MSEX008674 [Manduca sexta]|uniref:Uncharacterized protein n=1 Tax=Manduca sexta TaxID=7130 RepID=A0A921ZAQ0_MANSE|nr:hypothetical protein O3G_MSEX008674 [Manduca sexta]KAG6454426.1 hypothetical protein O3G_MSEX008674 [Manduca sexta]KAG6454427.1 hypothetical protein O3G_MSEX008674 [Manduca sexta]
MAHKMIIMIVLLYIFGTLHYACADDDAELLSLNRPLEGIMLDQNDDQELLSLNRPIKGILFDEAAATPETGEAAKPTGDGQHGIQSYIDKFGGFIKKNPVFQNFFHQ